MPNAGHEAAGAARQAGVGQREEVGKAGPSGAHEARGVAQQLERAEHEAGPEERPGEVVKGEGSGQLLGAGAHAAPLEARQAKRGALHGQEEFERGAHTELQVEWRDAEAGEAERREGGEAAIGRGVARGSARVARQRKGGSQRHEVAHEAVLEAEHGGAQAELHGGAGG